MHYGVGSNVSFLLSTALSIGIIGLMHFFKPIIVDSPSLTIFGGFSSSVLFVFVLTAINNLENVLFGDGFEANFIPEVVLALGAALSVAGTIHGVCVTTGFAFSAIALYYLHSLSQKRYGGAPFVYSSMKKKK
ncbi:protein KRTCAP2 homolog isoform X2 [Artemia franciscana]|uniref:protein KRTCAP2 homolog isoform X2 n=1 Tax=Artemia franciscana TaxID=6661 RepID=UPI0032D9E9A0